MKLSEQTIQQIKDLADFGMSGRKIAKQLGVSKSAVNNYINSFDYPNDNYSKGKAPGLLFFDLESAPDTAVTFSRFNANFTQAHIVKEGGYLLSIAFARNNGKVHAIKLTPEEAKAGDDSRLVWAMYMAIEFSDIVVAHNLHRFDWPLFLARCAYHGLSAPKKVQKIDTLRMAKQMKFQSNRLGSLAKVLGCEAKIETEGISLWVDCMNGDVKALEKMRKYNKGDVVTLREVYKKLRAVANTGVNFGAYYNDGQIHCPTCGSTNIEREEESKIVTNISTYDEYHCLSCGSRHKGRKAINSKEHRSLQLV